MAHPNFDPASNFVGKAQNVIIRYYAELNAMPLIADPDAWWEDWCWERSGASIVTRFYVPVQSFTPVPWTGSVQFSGTSAVFFDVNRGIFTLGVKETAMKIAEMDFGAFNLAPGSMAKAVGKLPQINFANALNAGFTTKDWTGTNFFAKTNVKPVCPGLPKLGKWKNAFENVAITPNNIVQAIKNIQGRLGFDGQTLNLKPLYLFTSPGNEEQFRQLLEVQRLLPLTIDGVSGGGNDSPVFGRLKIVRVPGLRDDLYIVGSLPEAEWLRPLARVMGGETGTYDVNTDPQQSGSGVPHVIVLLFAQDSEMFKKHLELGVAEVVNEGWSLATPHCLCANYTGAAS